MAETENKGDVKTEPTPESTAETTAEPTSESAAETTAEPTALERKIYQQVEYYFGDHNLTRDRFLQGEIKKDDGWVALETLVKFNRLKALSDDYGVICAALQKSPSKLMEVNEDQTKVRRLPSKSLPKNTEQWRSENKARTVYCKGFHQDDTLDVIQQFFQDKGKVETVFMRRNENKEFKGSVFATFSSLDDAKKFVETEGIQYKGEDVKKMFKNEYFNMKLEEKKKKKEEEKRQLEEETDQLEKKKAEEKQKDVEYTKGCILHFSGAPGDSVREEVSKVFQPFGDVKWIDFNKGDTKGTVRFSTPGAAAAAAQEADGKVTLKGEELTCRVLEGEEEKQHWLEVYENQSKVRQQKKKMKFGQGRGRGRGRGRGGRGRYRGDRDHDRNTTFQGKKTRLDSDGEGSDGERQQKMDDTSASAKRRLEESVKEEEPAKKHLKTEAD